MLAVLGLGHWGTAIAQHLASKGEDVLGWSVDDGVADTINSEHRNPRFLSHIQLSTNVRATDDISEVAKCDRMVVVLPSAAFSDVLPKVGDVKGRLVISATKGLDAASGLTPLQCIEKYLPNSRRAVISGPGFAKDIAAHYPAGLVAAAYDEATAKETLELFSSETLRIYSCLDPLGVEIGGIVKNVIAIAAGVSDGLQLGDSARAGVITRGLAEMMRLAVALGAEAQTLSGLSGLGDLVLTATCDNSRNRTVGLRLGRGEKIDEIIKTLGSVAEGVHTAALVVKLARSVGVEMPICEQVQLLIEGKISPQMTLKNLMTRPSKSEFYGL